MSRRQASIGSGRIATMGGRRNVELWRLWRRAADRRADYPRERMASICTWMGNVANCRLAELR